MRICAVGDNVVDRYVDQDLLYPGGNAVNVAVHARRSGALAAYIGVVGSDRSGQIVLDSLRAEHVDVSRVRIEDGPNAYAIVQVVGGERRFASGSLGVSAFTLSPEDLSYLRGFDLIHTGDCSGLESQVRQLAAAGPVSYDFAEQPQSYAEPLLPYVTMATFSVGPQAPREDITALVSWAHGHGPRWVLVTRGSAGAAVSVSGDVSWASADPGPVIDTLGAGDAFIARAAVSLLAGVPAEDAADAAVGCAAQVCRSFGAFGYAAPDTAIPSRRATSDAVSPSAS